MGFGVTRLKLKPGAPEIQAKFSLEWRNNLLKILL